MPDGSQPRRTEEASSGLAGSEVRHTIDASCDRRPEEQLHYCARPIDRHEHWHCGDAPGNSMSRDRNLILARAIPRQCGLHALGPDRKSTRLNSSHGYISYTVFCLKKTP